MPCTHNLTSLSLTHSLNHTPTRPHTPSHTPPPTHTPHTHTHTLHHTYTTIPTHTHMHTLHTLHAPSCNTQTTITQALCTPSSPSLPTTLVEDPHESDFNPLTVCTSLGGGTFNHRTLLDTELDWRGTCLSTRLPTQYPKGVGESGTVVSLVEYCSLHAN